VLCDSNNSMVNKFLYTRWEGIVLFEWRRRNWNKHCCGREKTPINIVGNNRKERENLGNLSYKKKKTTSLKFGHNLVPIL
jgi:hypothetical protein